MMTRERNPQEHTTAPLSPTESAAANTDAARDAGNAFLRAADIALDLALSSEPERFLQQNRQLGGQ
jgi:hypothetical protein